MSFHTNLQPEDKPAAFTGLIAGVIFVGVIMYGMVLWTNSRFEGHAPPAGAATTAH